MYESSAETIQEPENIEAIEQSYKMANHFNNILSKDYDLHKAASHFESVYKVKLRDQRYYYAAYYTGLALIIRSKENTYPKIMAEGINRLSEAAESGIAEAQYNLGWLHANANKLGLKKIDIPSSKKWFKEARKNFKHQADEGDGTALFHYGRMLHRGYGGDEENGDDHPDDAGAAEFYRRAIEKSVAGAFNNLGWLYKEHRIKELNTNEQTDYSKAIEYFTEGVKLGHPLAQFNLGALKLLGLGFKKSQKELAQARKLLANATRALPYYLSFATNFSIDGKFTIAYIYCYGLGKISRNYKIAKKWIEQVIEEASKESSTHAADMVGNAYFLLGKIQEFGHGNIDDALINYANAYRAGNAEAKSFYTEYNKFKKELEKFFKQNKDANRVHAYAYFDNIEDLKKLHDEELVNFNYPATKSKKTPLHFAAENGKYKAAKLLIGTFGVDTAALDKDNNTPLHLAANSTDRSLIDLLLQTNPKNCFKENHHGRTPLDIAFNQNNSETIELFAKFRQEGNTILHLSIESSTDSFIQKLNTMGFLKRLLNAKDEQGNTALHLAAKLGKLNKFKELLQHGCNIIEQNSAGQTVLMLAIQLGDKEKIKEILNTITDPSMLHRLITTADNNGNTALHYAALEYRGDIVKLLLTYGSKHPKSPRNDDKQFSGYILQANKKFQTAIDIAGERNSSVIKQLLLHQDSPHVSTITRAINDCAVQYLGGVNNTSHDQKLLGKYINAFIHTDIKEVQNRTKELKCLAQWYGERGKLQTAKGSEDFGKWIVEDFLAINIKYLFEFIVRIKKGQITDIKSDNTIVINGLIKELCCELKMLRARRDYLVCDQYYNLSYDLTECLAQDIVKNIKLLKDGDENSYNIGFLHHAMYLNFYVEEDMLYVSIDDLGKSHNKHVAHTGNNHTTYYPFVASTPLLTLDQQFLNKYLKLAISSRNMGSDIAIENIYSITQSQFTKLGEDELKKHNITSSRLLQADNCVVENFMIGFERRLNRIQKDLDKTVLFNILGSIAGQTYLKCRRRMTDLSDSNDESSHSKDDENSSREIEHEQEGNQDGISSDIDSITSSPPSSSISVDQELLQEEHDNSNQGDNVVENMPSSVIQTYPADINTNFRRKYLCRLFKLANESKVTNSRSVEADDSYTNMRNVKAT